MNEYQFQAVHSVELPSSSQNKEYIFDIKSSSVEDKLLLSASNYYLYLYNPDLNLLRSHSAHSDTITSISFAKTAESIYYSSSLDKTVAIWDYRAPPVAQHRLKFNAEVNAMAVNPLDNLLLINENNEILFYDLRMIISTDKKPKALGRYSDVHSDMVTQLYFSPGGDPNIFMSGAEDGLIGVYSLTAGASEDAVLNVLPTESPINRIGFHGPGYEGIYATSTIETATLWHYPSSQRLHAFNNIREQLGVDYLVDCIFDPTDSALYMGIGNHEGQMNFLHMSPESFQVINQTPLHCHSSTVRCIHSPDVEKRRPLQTIYSGGEDGRLSMIVKRNAGVPLAQFSTVAPASQPIPSNEQQQTQSSSSSSPNNRRTAMDIGAARVKVTHKNRDKPY
jgi:WD40 repeat protein